MEEVTVRYPGYTKRIFIEPTGSGQYRVATVKRVHLKRSVRIQHIKDAIEKEAGLSISEIARRIKLDRRWVSTLIKEEKIDRNLQ